MPGPYLREHGEGLHPHPHDARTRVVRERSKSIYLVLASVTAVVQTAYLSREYAVHQTRFRVSIITGLNASRRHLRCMPFCIARRTAKFM